MGRCGCGSFRRAGRAADEGTGGSDRPSRERDGRTSDKPPPKVLTPSNCALERSFLGRLLAALAVKPAGGQGPRTAEAGVSRGPAGVRMGAAANSSGTVASKPQVKDGKKTDHDGSGLRRYDTGGRWKAAGSPRIPEPQYAEAREVG